VVRFALFLAFGLLAHYLLARFVVSVSPWARARRRRVFAVLLGGGALVATLRIVAWLTETVAMRSAVAIAMIELAVVVIGLVFVGVKLLVTRGAAHLLPAKPREALVSRREAIERIGGTAIFGMTGAALAWGTVRGRHEFELREVVVKIPGWPRVLDGYVIAQVSDIHVGAFVGDRELDEGFELVQRIRPDLLVATGDLVDFLADVTGPLAKRLLAAPARDGVYAILGNHDHYAGALDVAANMRAAGVKLLVNESVRLRAEDGGGFVLGGVDDYMGAGSSSSIFSGPDLVRTFGGVSPDLPRILLAHQPRYFKVAAGAVGLQLSGHTHGGQINPGFRPASFLMEFVDGRYDRAGSTLWVNRGFGVAGPPARILAPPEVSKIVIVSG
jgi:predicted MPP superfamily phosphohydrolase